MTLAELIYKRFTESESLTKYLTKYQGKPAVFNPAPPDDIRNGWNGTEQYPRIIYSYDMQANTERKSAGTLSVSLYCQSTAEVAPEAIEPEIRKCLKDVLMQPGDGSLYAFAWARSDAFEVEEKKNDLIIGSDIRFDIMEFPNQETTDPDPVVATSRYIKELYPESIVVGLDDMPDITEATKEKPVIYCGLDSVDKAEETNTVAWMHGKISVHIFCPDSSTRLKMTAAIVNRMSLDGEIIMLDFSPMFIRRLQIDNKSDYLKEGQIFVTGRYGLLRYKPKQYVLRTTTTIPKGGMIHGDQKDGSAARGGNSH